MEKLVFTDEWVKLIRKRYERRHILRHQRPEVYFVATQGELQTMRDEIEVWVAELPEDTRYKVVNLLRLPERFKQTYHELVIGSVLRNHGLQPEYEKSICGLTPDWYVKAKDDIPPFVVDVFTENPSEGQDSQDKQLHDLLARLKEIPVGVVLNVNLYKRKPVLDSRKNKEIVDKVSKWVINKQLPIGTTLEVQGVIFEVIQWAPQYRNIQYLASPGAFRVNPKPLRKNLEKKASKYKVLVFENGFPLVVGVIADFRTGFALDDLSDVVFGQESVEITFGEPVGEILEKRLVRRDDGLFRKSASSLSAVMWVWKSGSAWNFKVVHNPRAAKPLPVTVFGG